MYRQGDVLIIPTDRVPERGAKEIQTTKERVVLAYGEVTGHAHAFYNSRVKLFHDAALERAYTGTIGLLVVKDGKAELRHEEHHTIEIPAGTYEVRRQREYSALDEERLVAD